MMRKNAILGAALAGVLGAVSVGSQAGTVGSLPRVFAYPLFQGTTAVGGAIAPVSFSTAAPLSTTNNYYVYVSLTAGGAFDAIYVPATTDLKIVDTAQAPIVGRTGAAVA